MANTPKYVLLYGGVVDGGLSMHCYGVSSSKKKLLQEMYEYFCEELSNCVDPDYSLEEYMQEFEGVHVFHDDDSLTFDDGCGSNGYQFTYAVEQV